MEPGKYVLGTALILAIGTPLVLNAQMSEMGGAADGFEIAQHGPRGGGFDMGGPPPFGRQEGGMDRRGGGFPGGGPGQQGPQSPRGMAPGGGPPMFQDPEAKALFEKVAGLRQEMIKTTRRYQEAKQEEKAALKEQLRKNLSELFDADVAVKEFRLKKIQEDASRLKERLAKGKAQKERIVEERLSESASEEVRWGW